MIRPYTPADFEALKRMHQQSGLPPACLPNPANELFTVKIIAEEKGRAVQAVFAKITAEGYLLVDHDYGTPAERLTIMDDLIIRGLATCAQRGFEDASVWLPPRMEKSFAPRLGDLGFEKSPWQSYTAVLK